MGTCTGCKFMTPSPTGDPSKGICIQARSKLPDTQKNPVAIKGKMIRKTDTCDNFESGESWKDTSQLI